MKKVGSKELGQILEHAKVHLIQMPRGARLMGMNRPLTDVERMSLCYLEAAMMVLGGLGVDSTNVLVEYDDSVDEPV
jgi:hypothetical protein